MTASLLLILGAVLGLVGLYIAIRRSERRRVEELAELAGVRRLPGESTDELRERAVRRFGAGLGLTARRRG
jgi:hypothetical protein